jgi:hypothetical protein
VLAGEEVEEANSSEKMAKQEEQKEVADESEVTAQGKENDGENDDSVDDDNQGTSNNEKKQKPPNGVNQDQHERESPSNDIQKAIVANCPGIACGGGLTIVLLVFLAICYGFYKRCCAPRKTKSPPAGYAEVELSNGYKDGTGSSGYKDEFVDEEDENDEDDAEYGITNVTL